jgi:predicted outer membrane repeat protein
VKVINSTLSDNSAASDGGGIYTGGTLKVINSTLSGNSASNRGGGIYVFSYLMTLENTLIANSPSGGDCVYLNTLIDGGHNLIEDSADACGLSHGVNGNLIGQDPNLGPLADNGGPTFTYALLDGSPALDAGSNAAAVDAQNQPLRSDQRGAGFVRIAGGTIDIGAFEAQAPCPAFPLSVGGEAELNNAIACYNTHDAPGAYQITLLNDIDLSASTATINNPTAGVSLVIDGAGFTVDGQGGFNVRPFTIAAATVVTIDSIMITRSNSHTQGGAIANRGTLTVRNSTLTGNSTTTEGGGIGNNGGTLTVINSTLSGNIAWFDGGGIANFDGSVTVINSTLSGNSADDNGDDILNFSGTLTLANTIIANSVYDSECVSFDTVIDQGHNLIEDSSDTCGLSHGVNGNIIGLDPNLGPLQDNGGPTFTHALLEGSPALDAGNNAICADPDTVNGLDQRGITRPQPTTGTCDIGAFEREVASPATLYQQVQGVRTALAALPLSGDSKTDKSLQKAIAKLDQGLATDLWQADGNHLTLLGEMAFHRLRDAVKELAKFKNPPQVVIDAINTLLTVTRTLAETALQEAAAGNAKLLAKAQKELIKAQQDLTKNQPANAMSHYEEAWEYAQQAMGQPIIAAIATPDDAAEAEDMDGAQVEAHVHEEEAAENELLTQQLFLPLVNR